VPAAVAGEIVLYAASLDEAVTQVWGPDAFHAGW
jgi:hypothetical protein